MGKSTKKSAPKVDASTAIAPLTKTLKKGKREAEVVVEKQTSVKKPKKDVGVQQAVDKRRSEAKTVKNLKKEETISAEESTSSDSEEEQKVKVSATKVAKPIVKESSSDSSSEDEDATVKSVGLSKKQPAASAKNGTTGKPALKNKSSRSSDDSVSSDEEDPKRTVTGLSKKVPVDAVKNGPVADSKKNVEPSDSDSEEENTPDEDDGKSAKVSSQAKHLPTSTLQKVPVVSSKNGSSYCSDESDSDEDKGKTVAAPKKKVDSSDSSAESDSEEEKADQEKDSEDESSEESDDEEPQRKKMKVPTTLTSKSAKPSAKAAEKDSGSDEESSEDKPSKLQSMKKPAQVSKKTSSSEDSSEDSSDDEEEEAPRKRETDVEMIDASLAIEKTELAGSKSGKKAPQTPCTPQAQEMGSKTIFVGNLSYSVEENDVMEFFKHCGEIADIRFSSFRDGSFKGFGHVEFTTAEAAQKAIELSGQSLLGRDVKIDLARERVAYTPYSGNERNSYQKGGRGQAQTIFVRGFDKNEDEDMIRSALQEHFQSCGEMSRIALPRDQDGNAKGFAYIDFKDSDAFNKALELNNSEFGESCLKVDEAKPRGDNRDNSGSGRGGGRSGGRDGGGRFGGRSGGRDGGRFGGRRGGRGGGGRGRGGGRGWGTSNKPSMATAGTGKKTTFDD